MAKITIENLHNRILLVEDLEKTLLQHFHSYGLDWMHACGGKGRCTTCKAIIISGADNLAPLTPAEVRYQSIKALRANERLSCQAKINGDITIRVPEEYKLPHITYSD